MSDTKTKFSVLVIAYSQSGGVANGVRSMCKPLEEASDVAVDYWWLKTEESYPYPWKKFRFFEVFPECILGEVKPNLPPTVTFEDRYDLIVLGWQPWYLAPSLPIQAFFQSEYVKLLKDTPVVSLIACRKMWHGSYAQVRGWIQDAGGWLIDNVVFTHQGHHLATLVTTVRMLWTGKKNSVMGLPDGGFDKQGLEDLERFGQAILNGRESLVDGPVSLMRGLGAVEIKKAPMWAETIGRAYYGPLAWVIRKSGKQGGFFRNIATILFGLHLIPAIIVILLLAAVSRILLAPVFGGKIERMAVDFAQPSGE